MQANKFCIKQQFSWYNRKVLCRPWLRSRPWLQILHGLLHWGFISPSLSLFFLLHSLKHITNLPTYPLNQSNAACKAGKNRACSAFSPFQDNAVACVVMWEGLVTYCLQLQAHPCSPEETLPSKTVCQSRLVSCCSQLCNKCWSFPLSSYPIPVVMYVALLARTVGGCRCNLLLNIKYRSTEYRRKMFFAVVGHQRIVVQCYNDIYLQLPKK